MCVRAKHPNKLAEADLIAQAQAGDERAQAYLLTEYGPLRGLIGKLARELDPKGRVRDDLRQVGQLEALRALGRFRPETGIRFTTFVYKRIRGAMLETIYCGHARTQTVEQPGGEEADGTTVATSQLTLISADAGSEDEPSSWEEDLANRDPAWGREPGFETIERVDQARHLRRTINDLSEDQREVIKDSFFRGQTHRQIADRRGVSHPAVTQMIGRATARLGRELENVRDSLAA